MRSREWKPGRKDRRVILALLSGASNLSGYPISRAAQVGSGQVHVCLARMEREGWVESDWGGQSTPYGRRRLYRLTARGRYNGLRALGLEDGRP